MSVRAARVLAALAALVGMAGAVSLGGQGCAGNIDDSPPDDGGAMMDDEVDAEAGPPLQCWCSGFGDSTTPADHQQTPDDRKCKPGWICGSEAPFGQTVACCEPRDPGIPNCFDSPDPDVEPRPTATPHALECKFCLHGEPCP